MKKDFKIREIDYFLVPLMLNAEFSDMRDMGVLDKYKEHIEYLIEMFPENERLKKKYSSLINEGYSK